ncbi:hypothetical protein, partial [Nocardia amamiensis]|uniref:hypothetical protein n=1 Tax=Nocardia amamiensis TaxID=404578 RepID=UPI001E328933
RRPDLRVSARLETRSPGAFLHVWAGQGINLGSIRSELRGTQVTASSRNSVNYQRFLELVEQANPVGDIHVITDNLSSHNSKSTR